MTPFHPQQSNRGRRVRQMTNANALQIHVTNCTAKLRSHVHEAGKIQCNNLQGAGQAYAAELKFYRVQALPLVKTRFLRLANSSPKTARSPARRSRDGRATSGTTSGEISAQRPGNGNRNAAERPSRRLARQLALRRIWPRNVRTENLRDNSQYSRAEVRATANATSYKQLVGFLAVSFNHDIQRL